MTHLLFVYRKDKLQLFRFLFLINLEAFKIFPGRDNSNDYSHKFFFAERQCENDVLFENFGHNPLPLREEYTMISETSILEISQLECEKYIDLSLSIFPLIISPTNNYKNSKQKVEERWLPNREELFLSLFFINFFWYYF